MCWPHGSAVVQNLADYTTRDKNMDRKAWFERSYHWLGGVGVTVLLFFLVPVFPVPADSAPSLFSAVVSLSAIAVGFLATAKSILFTIDKKRIISQLKTAGKFNTLVDYLMMAVHWSFGLAVATSLCFVIDLKNPATWHRYVFAGWFFVLSTAALAYYRVVHIFAKILRLSD